MRATTYTKQIVTDLKRQTAKNNSRGLQYSTFSNEKIIQTENQQGTLDLDNTSEQIKLIDIYRTLHPRVAEYTFFSITHITFFRTNHRSIPCEL